MVHVPKKVTKCETCGNKHPYYDGDCPLTEVFTQRQDLEIGEDFFGESPAVFVGRSGYPEVNVGPTAAPEQETAAKAANPREWFGLPYDKVIGLRAALIRSKQKHSVHQQDEYTQENQLLSMAKKPTDVELSFAKQPKTGLEFDNIVHPSGVTGSLDSLEIAENVRIRRPVEYIVSDELTARKQAWKLYQKNVSPYKIQTILSSGVLGQESRKKLVPTRWSVTGVDDMLADQLINQVKDAPAVNDWEIYESEYLYNTFLVLVMPGNWEFENFEAWAPKTEWASTLREADIKQEYEPYDGRWEYADSQAGAYYAAKFAVAEHLHERGRQARVVVFREVSEKYVFPVGVWQVRENVRNALQRDPRTFDTRQQALTFLEEKLDIPFDRYKEESQMLQQKRLQDFF